MDRILRIVRSPAGDGGNPERSDDGGRETLAEANPLHAQGSPKGIGHPVSTHAGNAGAGEGVRQALGRLPDRRLEAPADVGQAPGKVE